MAEMTVWAVKIKHLDTFRVEDKDFVFLIATKSGLIRDAKELAIHQYPTEWWDENIIANIVPVGKLRAAEGFDVPQADLDM
jgi:hypothetical protein